jgi:hypothetical protein
MKQETSKWTDPRFATYYRWLNSSNSDVKKALKLFRHETNLYAILGGNIDAFREWCYDLGLPTEAGLLSLSEKYEEAFR